MHRAPSSHRSIRWLPLATPLLLVLISAAEPPKPAPPPSAAELARHLKQLDRRLERLESLMGKPFGAELTAGTVLERLDRLERGLTELRRTRSVGQMPRGGSSDTTLLRRRLDDASRQLERMQRQTQRTLDDLRRELRDARRVNDQVRDLRRAIERLQRDLDSLERRVSRLERP